VDRRESSGYRQGYECLSSTGSTVESAVPVCVLWRSGHRPKGGGGGWNSKRSRRRKEVWRNCRELQTVCHCTQK
jgi:hypothetical protein